ncbi:MAG: twin-arginine translocase TatA/TatE family subunit [Planctomycetes bacterium]|nr:twin-arginine translocase TatA/TatE family subunit [Planctomycetota bacterium]
MLGSVLGILPSLGFQEMFVLLVIGLLLYGRNLPEAGRSLGRIVAQLKRGFNEFKDQLDRDANVSEMKETFRSTKDEIRRVSTVQRTLTDPGSALKQLTHESLSSPLPDDPASTNGEAKPDKS